MRRDATLLSYFKKRSRNTPSQAVVAHLLLGTVHTTL